MKLSCLPVSYFSRIIQGRMTVGQWARQAAALALDAIDLSILFFRKRNPDHLERIRKDIETAGMRVALMNTYPDFTHPDPREREHQSSQLAEDIAASALLNVEAVRVTSGQAYPETRRADGIRWVTEGLSSATETAECHGVKLVYENHSKPGIWDYADFNLPSAVFLEIAERIRDMPVGILFDTANPLVYGDDPLSVLEPVIDRVDWVHAADTGVRGALKPVAIGAGEVPFDQIFTRLRSAGFEGGISIEEASGLGRTGVEKAVQFVRRAWRQAGA